MGFSWLVNAQIDGGSRVDLLSYNATYDFNNLTDSPQIPGKNTGSSYTFRLAEIDYVGHVNPRFIVEGYIPSGMLTNTEGSVTVSPTRLGSFLTIGSPSWFGNDYLIINPAGSACVFPISLRMRDDVTSSPRMVKYSLTLEETKEW
jgi:hypothetical protein